MLPIGLQAPHLKEKRTRMEKGEVEGERSTLNSGNTIFTRSHGFVLVPNREAQM